MRIGTDSHEAIVEFHYTHTNQNTLNKIQNSRIIRNVPKLLNQLKNPSMIPPMTTPRRFRPTVQNPLNAQVDIDSLSATCDLDAVRQGRDGAVGPA